MPKTVTKAVDEASQRSNGNGKLSPERLTQHFEDGYREIEILPDGTLRERIENGYAEDELVTRSLKTERVWY